MGEKENLTFDEAAKKSLAGTPQPDHLSPPTAPGPTPAPTPTPEPPAIPTPPTATPTPTDTPPQPPLAPPPAGGGGGGGSGASGPTIKDGPDPIRDAPAKGQDGGAPKPATKECSICHEQRPRDPALRCPGCGLYDPQPGYDHVGGNQYINMEGDKPPITWNASTNVYNWGGPDGMKYGQTVPPSPEQRAMN